MQYDFHTFPQCEMYTSFSMIKYFLIQKLYTNSNGSWTASYKIELIYNTCLTHIKVVWLTGTLCSQSLLCVLDYSLCIPRITDVTVVTNVTVVTDVTVADGTVVTDATVVTDVTVVAGGTVMTMQQ